MQISWEVQISWEGSTWKSDREIIQRTVLLERPMVTPIASRDLAPRSILSADGKKKARVGFLVSTWAEMMSAALAPYPTATLRYLGTPQSRIVFAAPPGPQNTAA